MHQLSTVHGRLWSMVGQPLSESLTRWQLLPSYKAIDQRRYRSLSFGPDISEGQQNPQSVRLKSRSLLSSFRERMLEVANHQLVP